MLEIFCCELHAVGADALARYRELLSAEELERLAAFRRENAAQAYLVSRALLRTVLAEQLGCTPQSLQFARDVHDKPYLVPAADGRCALHFNLSHSEDWIALAISDAPVGVDVESSARNNNILGIAKRFFAPAESESLNALPEDARAEKFCELWTVKEACVKWSGLGIGRALAGVGVAIEGGRIALNLRADIAAFGAARALLFALTPSVRLAVVGERVDSFAIYRRVPLGLSALIPGVPLAQS